MVISADETQVYLSPTPFIQSDASEIIQLAASLKKTNPVASAIALFNWVRDNVRYDPLTAADPREFYKATHILARKRGYCVQKAVLLATLGRAANIPTRLGFVDVVNHKLPEKLRKKMGTNLFVFHGYVEFFVDGKWIKATPAFDPGTTKKAGALLVTLDGVHDALLHPVDPQGQPHIEYVRSRGTYADLPFEEIQQVFLEVYPFMSELFYE